MKQEKIMLREPGQKPYIVFEPMPMKDKLFWVLVAILFSIWPIYALYHIYV